MELAAVIERVQAVSAVCADRAAGAESIESGLRTIAALRSWLAAAEATLTGRLGEQVSFPEERVAECGRGSLRDGARVKERADTLASLPGLAEALSEGRVTAGHVDAVTRAVRSLDSSDERAELRARVAGLLDVAAAGTVDQFRRRLDQEIRAVRRGDGMDRLERQQRATGLRTWVDGEGMVRLAGRFDPVTGRRLVARLDGAVQALFAESVPATCPTDPIAKQQHLQALALERLVCSDDAGVGVRPGRPEFVVVVDVGAGDSTGGPAVDWGLPIEVPHRVLASLMSKGSVHPVVVRNGVVLHAPGQLDLGRSTRLANRAQRRALRALYPGCAIPGCSVRYDRCKLHHITWWRHGGRTDLANLLPLCTQHHSKVHSEGWELRLGPGRELEIRFPDGRVRNTGPPSRAAA